MINPQPAGVSTEQPAVGHVQALVGSLTRVNFYPSVARQPLGRAFAYLLMLVAVVWVIDSWHVFQMIERGREWTMGKVRERMPNLRIEDGVVSADVPQPHVLIETVIDGQKLIVAVDTAERLKLQDYDVAIVLRKSDLVTRSGLQTRTIQLSKVKRLELGPKEAEHYVHKACDTAAVLAIFLLPFYHFLAKLLTALFLSIAAAAANRSGRRGYEYKSLFQISLYALTPVVVLESIGYLAGHPLWFWGFLLGMMFAVLGTLARLEERPIPS